MNLLMIIRVALRALVRNKMRATLTMLGIIIGVAAVIAMVSIGQGAQASVQAQIEGIGTNLLFLSAGAQNVGGVRSGTGDSGTNTLTVEDLEAIRREVPSVSMVTPTINARSQLVAGNMNWNTQVQGVSEQYPEVRKWTIQSGEFFSETDVRTAARVIVVGQTIGDNLFPKDWSLEKGLALIKKSGFDGVELWLGDKPWLIQPEQLDLVLGVATSAPLAMDIMTERHEIASRVQKTLMARAEVFGNFV